MQIVLIGLGAGAAAALLFASVTSGVIVSVFLFYLAPLPIMIAALGWSHWAGLTAAVVAAAILGGLFGIFFFGTFLATIGAPAWWLGYLSLLARPDPVSGGLIWYPAGALVLWSAVLGALVMLAVIPFYGWDLETFRASLRTLFTTALQVETDGAPTPLGDSARFINFLVDIMPAAAAALGTIINLLNLWLAGRILDISGRLRRPWPDLPAMRLPLGAPALLIAALVVSYAGGMLGLVASVIGSALLIAHAVVGLAVVHMMTRGRPGRAGMLAALYALLPVFALLRVLHWPVLALAALALIDCVFDLRGRMASRQPPVVRE